LTAKKISIWLEVDLALSRGEVLSVDPELQRCLVRAALVRAVEIVDKCQRLDFTLALESEQRKDVLLIKTVLVRAVICELMKLPDYFKIKFVHLIKYARIWFNIIKSQLQ
jgi:hypothetical protein